MQKLQNYPPPRNVTQTRSFLGFTNFYRKFIKDYGNIAKPLHNLTKKETKFIWTDECQKAFETLKTMVTTSPLLIYPRFNQPFLVSTDASNVGCGAILSQVVDERDQPIVYCSRKFTATESNYTTVEKELYAVVLALKHWRHYLYGQTIHVYSDQRSLSWGIRQPDSVRLTRFVQKLSEFTDLKIFYRRGSSNQGADFLSRMDPLPRSELLYQKSNINGKAVNVSVVAQLGIGNNPADYWLNEQMKDQQLQQVMAYLSSGTTVVSEPIRKLASKYSLSDPDGCLVFVTSDGSELYVVPSHLCSRLLEEMHDAPTRGHLGYSKTLHKLKQKFYWDGMRQDVENWIQSCQGCLTRKSPTHPIRQPMVPISAVAPWQMVTIDIVGPLPRSSKGNQWILVMQDRFSKWPECAALRNVTAPTVARTFLIQVVTRHGIPLVVSSDRGAQFTSAVFQQLSKLLGMKQGLSTAYRPQTQGLVERWNRTMMEMLRQFTATTQKDWCAYLDVVMFAYRTSQHFSTGFTPFHLIYGREARLPTHLLLPERLQEEPEHCHFVEDLRKRLKEAFDLAFQNNENASQQQKKSHDRSLNPSNLKVGEKGYLQRPTPVVGLSPKLQTRFKGPYTLTLVLGSNGQLVAGGGGRSKPFWAHLDHMRRAVPRELPDFNYDDVPEPVPNATSSTPADVVDEPPTARNTDDQVPLDVERIENADDHAAETIDQENLVKEEPDVEQPRYNLRSRRA